MTSVSSIKQQVVDVLDTLSPVEQEQVLAFARQLAHRQGGIPGKELAEFFQQFHVTPEEAANMQAIMDEIAQLR